MRFGLFIMGTRSGSYGDILEQVSRAESLGFDTVVLAERHFEHGDLLYPSPFSVGAAIAAQTRTIRIATAARILTFDHPIHVAEDAATLDVISGGRLDFGAARAALDEHCHDVFESPVGESRGRFEEALEVIVKAWTEESFSHEGEHFRIPEVSVHPKPLQRAHPPIFLVAVSPQTLTFAARAGYSAFVGGILTVDELAETVAGYWRTRREVGLNGAAPELSLNRFIYVAESDEQARRELEGPFMEFIEHRAPDLRAALLRKYGDAEPLAYERLVRDFCVVGAPETVAAQLRHLQARTDMTYLLCSLNFITLEHRLCERSMELLAREVMPALAPQRVASR